MLEWLVVYFIVTLRLFPTRVSKGGILQEINGCSPFLKRGSLSVTDKQQEPGPSPLADVLQLPVVLKLTCCVTQLIT